VRQADLELGMPIEYPAEYEMTSGNCGINWIADQI
jgi:hypothetical protein